jgi:hypothetical protein
MCSAWNSIVSQSLLYLSIQLKLVTLECSQKRKDMKIAADLGHSAQQYC